MLDANGDEMPVNQQGSIAIKLPLPPGCLPTIWGDFERLRSGYLRTFPGYYVSGDGGYKDEDGYIFIMGRTDDVINVAIQTISTPLSRNHNATSLYWTGSLEAIQKSVAAA